MTIADHIKDLMADPDRMPEDGPSTPPEIPEPVNLGEISEEGRKDDKGKPRWDLLPFLGVGAVVDVLTYGAKKYGADNWRFVPLAESRYFAAALRHLAAWKGGGRLDPETGLPHLAHAVCCLLFLLELEGSNDDGG